MKLVQELKDRKLLEDRSPAYDPPMTLGMFLL